MPSQSRKQRQLDGLFTIGSRWRGVDIVFSTEDCLVCALQVKSERRARATRVDPLSWVLRTPTPLHGMRPHPQIRHGPFFAVSADMRVLQVPFLPRSFLALSLLNYYGVCDGVHSLIRNQISQCLPDLSTILLYERMRFFRRRGVTMYCRSLTVFISKWSTFPPLGAVGRLPGNMLLAIVVSTLHKDCLPMFCPTI